MSRVSDCSSETIGKARGKSQTAVTAAARATAAMRIASVEDRFCVAPTGSGTGLTCMGGRVLFLPKHEPRINAGPLRGVAGEPSGHVHPLRNAREFRIVDRLRLIAWSVVVRVQVAREEERWNVALGIGHMIAAEIPAFRMRGAVPQRIDDELAGRPVRVDRHLHERGRVAMWWLRAHQRRRVRMIAAEHVTIQHRDDLFERHNRMRDVISRAEQSPLLGAVKDEERRALAGLLLPRAGDGKERNARAGVVVGAIPDRVATDDVADTVVILMGAEQDVLVAELRTGAA